MDAFYLEHELHKFHEEKNRSVFIRVISVIRIIRV